MDERKNSAHPWRPVEVPVNVGIVVKAPDSLTAEQFGAELEKLAESMGLRIIFRKVSLSRLWIREGDGP